MSTQPNKNNTKHQVRGRSKTIEPPPKRDSTPGPKRKGGYPTPKADKWVKQPGTLAWYYGSTIDTPDFIASLFIDAPYDPDIIPNEKKDAFSLLWMTLPRNAGIAYRESIQKDGYDPERHQKSKVILDILCEELRISTKRFLQFVEGSVLEMMENRLEHIRKLRVGSLYEKSLDFAMNERGFKDRNAILQQEGFHYAPKANSINIGSNNRTINVERGLPVFEETVKNLNSILVEPESQLQLGEGSTFSIEVNEEEEELEDA
jgi:hypothetical protein